MTTKSPRKTLRGTGFARHWRPLARPASQPAPGRLTPVRLTGATEHAIGKALAELANEIASAGESHHDQPIGDLDVQALVDNGDRQPKGGDSNADFISSGAPGESRPPTPTTAPPAGGRTVAWAGLVFGGLASLAANRAAHLAARRPPATRLDTRAGPSTRRDRLANRPANRGRSGRPSPLAKRLDLGVGALRRYGSGRDRLRGHLMRAPARRPGVLAIRPLGGRGRPAGTRRPDDRLWLGAVGRHPPAPSQHRQVDLATRRFCQPPEMTTVDRLRSRLTSLAGVAQHQSPVPPNVPTVPKAKHHSPVVHFVCDSETSVLRTTLITCTILNSTSVVDTGQWIMAVVDSRRRL